MELISLLERHKILLIVGLEMYAIISSNYAGSIQETKSLSIKETIIDFA